MRSFSLFFLVLIPRLFYIFFYSDPVELSSPSADSASSDWPAKIFFAAPSTPLFYSQIATNILNGCGFSASFDPVLCEPITGGYFPAYPYFLAALQYFDLPLIAAPLFVAIAFSLAVVHLKLAIEVSTNKPKLAAWTAVAIGLSPLSLGFSRDSGMEPILVVFSIAILGQLLFLIHKKNLFNVYATVALVIFATYFKPTAVLFVVPFALAVTLTFKRRSSALLLIISSLLFAIAISPWEYRNWRLSGTSIVHGSSVYPKIDGYHAWVKSWAVTEYERAYATFPVWERRLDDISIKPNYFLSESEARQAYDLILKAKIDNNLWTEAIDNQFKHLAGLRYRRMSFFDWLLLRTWQSLSLLAHPANSWGFPIHLSSNNFYTKVSEYSIDSQVFRDLEKIILKGALFCYRVILLGIFFIGCLLFLKKFIVNFREIAKANFKPTRRTLETANSVYNMYLLAMSMFFASIFFFVFFYYAHEHRFLTIVMPWIEVAACLFVAQKMTFSEK